MTSESDFPKYMIPLSDFRKVSRAGGPKMTSKSTPSVTLRHCVDLLQSKKTMKRTTAVLLFVLEGTGGVGNFLKLPAFQRA